MVSFILCFNTTKGEKNMNLTNENYLDYINSDDKVLFHTKQSPKYLLLSVLKTFIISLIILTYPILICISELKNINLAYILSAIIILSVVFDFLRYQSVHYAITNKGVYKIFGILNKKIKFVPFRKITDTALNINVLESILSIGTINISTAGGTKTYSGTSQPYEISIKHIDEYKIANEILSKNI